MRRLEGRVALVTGSTQGLGEGIALRLGLAGAAVMLNGRSAQKGAGALARLRRQGTMAEFLQADLCLRAEAQRLVETTVTHFGRLDILVNNAQIAPPLVEAHETRIDELLQQALASGLYASLWTAQAALPWLQRAGGGRIVNFASINGVSAAVMVQLITRPRKAFAVSRARWPTNGVASASPSTWYCRLA